ncbi:hypothetical protein ACWGRN_29950, partial [Streptomyces albidoflavus]
MALLLDASPAAVGAPAPRRPRWRALLMVVMTLALTTVMVWTGTGTSDALVGNVLKRVAVPASRFVAKNALRIGEAAQNAQKVALDKAVKLGYQTALWGYNTWRDVTEDQTVEGLPLPAPVKESVESPSDGFGQASPGSWCTVKYSDAQWTAGTVVVLTTAVKGSNGSFSQTQFQSTCQNGNGLSPYVRGDMVCVKSTGQKYIQTNRSVTVPTPSSAGAGSCMVSGDASTYDAQVRSVFVFRNGTTNPGIVWESPVEIVNPEFREITYNQSTMTGRKKCVSESNPLDVQMVTRTGYGTEMFPLVPCPPGYYPEWVEYEHQLDGTSPIRKMGRIEINPGQYPQCEMGTCTLKVSVDGETCVVGLEKCYDWLHTNPPSRLKCEYGPYAVGIDECEALEFAYRTQAGLTVDPTEQLQPGRLVPSTPT